MFQENRLWDMSNLNEFDEKKFNFFLLEEKAKEEEAKEDIEMTCATQQGHTFTFNIIVNE